MMQSSLVKVVFFSVDLVDANLGCLNLNVSLVKSRCMGLLDQTAVGNPCPYLATFCFPSSPKPTIWFLYLRGSSSGFCCNYGITRRAHRDFIAASTRNALTSHKPILNWTWISGIFRSLTCTRTL